MNSLRKHVSYANVVATLALVFAMSGAAVAANHYLIDSTTQINPKVLKKLKGHAGKTGRTGPQGQPGSPGAAGTVDTSKFFNKTESDGRYLGKGEQAADSTKLAGVAASGYTSGEGSQGGRWLEMVDKGKEANFLFVPNIGELSLECFVTPRSIAVQLTQHAGGAVFLTWGSYPELHPTTTESVVLKEDGNSLAKPFGPPENGTGQMIIQASSVGTSVHTYATITVSAAVVEGFCRFQANYTVAQQRF